MFCHFFFFWTFRALASGHPGPLKSLVWGAVFFSFCPDLAQRRLDKAGVSSHRLHRGREATGQTVLNNVEIKLSVRGIPC